MKETEKNIDPVESRFKNFSGEKKLELAMHLIDFDFLNKKINELNFELTMGFDYF